MKVSMLGNGVVVPTNKVLWEQNIERSIQADSLSFLANHDPRLTSQQRQTFKLKARALRIKLEQR